jgi:hypothetical protein
MFLPKVLFTPRRERSAIRQALNLFCTLQAARPVLSFATFTGAADEHHCWN